MNTTSSSKPTVFKLSGKKKENFKSMIGSIHNSTMKIKKQLNMNVGGASFKSLL